MTGATVPTVRFGVLGCGDIAVRRTLPAMRWQDGVELVAVASRDPERAAKVAADHGVDAVADYSALLARSDVDAVYLPLPTGLHHPWARRALAAGKHVLSEKPLATRHADAAELAALARARGLVLMENLTFPWHPVHRFVRELVAAGRIGELRAVHGEFGFPPLPATDVRYDPALGGGALLDVAVYPLRAARMFLGDELAVVGATLDRDPDRGVDVAGSVLLAAPEGRTAHLTFGFRHAYRCAYTLWGSRGRLVLDRAFTPPPRFVPTVRIDGPDGSAELAGPADDQFGATLAAFARGVREPATATALVEDVLHQARLLDRIAESAAEFLQVQTDGGALC